MIEVKKAPGFEYYKRLNKLVMVRVRKLEGKNGLLQQAFKEWEDIDYSSSFRNSHLYIDNIILKQESDEKKFQGKENSLRFYEPYYDSHSKSIAKGEIPDFLKTKLDVKVNVPKEENDSEQMKIAQKEFRELTDEEKREHIAEMFKTLAILSARIANIFNRFKESERKNFEDTMTQKDIQMMNFLVYAIKYNSLVPEEKQIAFGINGPIKEPVLEASLPGYTRLSLHFGGSGKCAKLLTDVNSSLKQNGMEKFFPTYKDSEEVSLNAIMKQDKYGYPFDKFNVKNTGIINNRDVNNSEIYQKQMRGKEQNKKDNMDAKRIEIFANFMYPDLNEREMFYLAEKAGFGKKDLLSLQRILNVRSNRRIRAEKNGKDLRKQYIFETINNEKGLRKQIKKLDGIYEAYLETAEIYKDEIIDIESFETILHESGLEEELIDEFLMMELEKETAELKHSETYNQMKDSVKQQGVIARKNIDTMENKIQNQQNQNSVGENDDDDENDPRD